jgi:hypothetical protein
MVLEPGNREPSLPLQKDVRVCVHTTHVSCGSTVLPDRYCLVAIISILISAVCMFTCFDCRITAFDCL